MAASKPDIPVGTIKAEVMGDYLETTWANVYYFAVGSSDPAHNEDVALLVHDATSALYATHLLDILSVNWHISNTKITYRDASDSHYKRTYVEDYTGGVSGGSQDAQVAYLINWATNDPRKGGKPRNYIVGVPDSIVAGSAKLLTSAISEASTDLNEWLAALNGMSHGTASALSLLEMSFRNGKTWRDSAATWPVRSAAISPYVATQRRRVDRLR
jgi:hypothetical protein